MTAAWSRFLTGPAVRGLTRRSSAAVEEQASACPAPGPGGFSCPPGQSLQIASVSYTNLLLTDTTNGESISVADFSPGCLLPKVGGACD